ncbi:MAG: endonuclease/exonuclease/phosphatase family protein [Chthoniobacterales bacterium]
MKILLAIYVGIVPLAVSLAGDEVVDVRVVAANLTCGRHPGYASVQEPEGAGARILQFLDPDVVLIQEFNTDIPVEAWVSETFGDEFGFHREDGDGIPNGVISRFPIVESGEWDDPNLENRDLAWARIELPNGRMLWAISVHLYGKRSEGRVRAAEELVRAVQEMVPSEDLVILGGDFYTPSVQSPSIGVLAEAFVTRGPHPVDQLGDGDTNANRTKPYDWIVAEEELDVMAVPVVVAGDEFPHGLVFDSRAFRPLGLPVRKTDSDLFQMQHMAVVRDFAIPALEPGGE